MACGLGHGRRETICPAPCSFAEPAQLNAPLSRVLHFLQQLFTRRNSRRVAGWQPAADPTPTQAAHHAAWVAARAYHPWLAAYFKAYHLQKTGIASRRGLRVELLREEGRQGALFFYDAAIEPSDFEHLFWLLSERVAQQGYYRACHDCRQRQQEQLHELTVKQLFKPTPTDCAHSGRCNQRFGLVHLDLVCLNNEPLFIRLSTNPVQEITHFTPAQSFECLLQALFDEPATAPERPLTHQLAE